MTILRRLLPLLFVLPGFGPADEPWNQWRGPNRDGSWHRALPAAWPDSLTSLWEVEVGEGHSSPVVNEGKVFVLSRQGDDETVLGLDLTTGKTVWRQSYRAPFEVNPYAGRHGKGPKSTPLAAQGRLFVLGISNILSAFEANTGKLLWKRDFSHETDSSKLFCGGAASPLILNGNLYVHVGDDREGAFLSINPADGSDNWAWRGDGPSYASPIAAVFDSIPQIVAMTTSKIVSLDPIDGNLLWQIPFPDEWNENIVTPVTYDEMLVISGVNVGTSAYRPTLENGDWSLTKLWERTDLPMYMSTPVTIGRRLLGLSSVRKGMFFALELGHGSDVWTSIGREGDNASFVAFGGSLAALTTDGRLRIIDGQADEFRVLADYSVADSPTWAHLTPVDKGFLVRSKSSLTRWSW